MLALMKPLTVTTDSSGCICLYCCGDLVMRWHYRSDALQDIAKLRMKGYTITGCSEVTYV